MDGLLTFNTSLKSEVEVERLLDIFMSLKIQEELERAVKALSRSVMPQKIYQSAEKNLKGYIALNGGQIQRIHDLVALNKVCLGYSPEFSVIEEDGIQLTDYGVQARYPFNLGLNESDRRNGPRVFHP